MTQQTSQIKLFCADNSILQPKDYIFDNTYRNVSEKKKFQKDSKYAYFNALIKMKQNYKQHKKDIYKYIFGSDSNQHQTSPRNIKSLNHQTQYQQIINPRQTFQVQKINNHSFKIYKGKNNSMFSKNLEHEDLNLLNDINFKVHFKKIAKQQQKPEFMNLLKEYKKVQNAKSIIDPQAQLRSKTKTSYMKRKSIQLSFHNQKLKNKSENKFSKINNLREKKSENYHNISSSAFVQRLSK